MANTYKDIIITPNRNSDTADPNISFRGANAASNTEITLRMYPDSNGTLSFEGSAGQLFSITNDLSGTIFSVNDVSGIPSLEIDASGFVEIAAFSGNVGIGEANTSNINAKLYVNGNMNVTSSIRTPTLNATTINAATVLTSGGINVSAASLNSYAQANAAYDQANTARTTANNAYGVANTAATNALNAYSSANLAYAQANSARDQANTARTTANDAYGTANTAGTNALNAYGQANAARGQANTAYGQANAAYDQANTARTTANNAYGVANTAATNALNAYSSANLAYAQANSARDQANTARTTANDAYGAANTAGTNALNAYGQANTARTTANDAFAQANTARTTANDAFAAANNRVLKSGDTMTGSLIIQGATLNTATANISTIVTGNALTLSTGTGSNSNIIFSSNGTEEMRITNTGFIGIFTTTPNSNLSIVGNVWVTTGINAATLNATTVNAATLLTTGGINVSAAALNAYGAANTAQTTAQNAYGTANTAATNALNAYGQANTARDQANTARTTANDAFAQANTARTQANTAYGQANAAYDQANTARTTANNAYGQANSAVTIGGNAYGQANSARLQANNAYAQANAAYDRANTGSTVTNDTTTNSTYYPVFTVSTSGLHSANVSSTKLTFNPSTGTLSATIFNSISDREAKENIRDLGYGLDTVLKMEGKKFELKESHETSIGFIAQDLEKLVPEVVLEHRDGYKGVNYGVIVAVLVEAIKQLAKRVEELEKK